MIDWNSITDDEFIEQANIRVNKGRWSPDRLMSDKSSDDRAKLDKLRSAIIGYNIDQMHAGPPYNGALIELARLCDQLDAIRGNPLPQQAYPVNTTHYGRRPDDNNEPGGM